MNAYEILGVPQNANNAQIIQAMQKTMRGGKCSPTDIAQARSKLSKPATRLAEDFTFPIFESFDDMKPLKAKLQVEMIDINSIDPNVYDSL